MATGTSNSSSNILSLNVIEPSFIVTKKPNKTNVKVGDSFFYTINIINNGDYPASDVIITDTLPSQFNVVEIKLNDVVVSGDISTGINIGPLDVGNSLVLTIYINVIDNIYNENGFINYVRADFMTILDPLQPPTTTTINAKSSSSVKIFNPELQLLKSSNIFNAAIGDTVTYTILVENSGNVTLTNIIVRDLLDKSLIFVDKSLKINGVLSLNASIASGIRINSLSPGESAIVTFDVLISGDISKTSMNSSTAQFNYIIDCNSFKQTGFATSNESELDILYHHVTLKKQSDDCTAKLTGIINYTITVENDGDVDILNFILKDKLPSNIRFLEDSFLINDIPFSLTKVDLLKGISIGSIPIGESSIIKYSAKISSNNCCKKCSFTNTANGIYYFEIADGSGRSAKVDKVLNIVDICK